MTTKPVRTWAFEQPEEWGPKSRGAFLIINPPPVNINTATVIDVETDEKDNFVGMAYCCKSTEVFYTTDISTAQTVLKEVPVVGHNLKADFHFLASNGVDVASSQLHFDTMLASYVMNPTKESHGLKNLAKEILNWEWPSYKEMVGIGKKKETLDKKSVELVANYCGMDCLATLRLSQYFNRVLTPNHRRILQHMELPIARLLFGMERQGITIDTDYLKQLDKRFSGELADLEGRLSVYGSNSEVA